MNKIDKQYQDLLQDILDNGVVKQDRTGTGTVSVFGRQIRHKMSEGFPLLTTKKMPWKSIVTELLWFLRGDTNIKYLVDNGCNIWNGDAYKNYESNWLKENPPMAGPYTEECLTQEQFIDKIRLVRFKTDDEFVQKWGELGPIYGKQWRRWELPNYSVEHVEYGADNDYYVDQIQNLINDLKTNPDSRRLMVNAWNVGELDQMVLPPCHYGFQVYTRELSLEERVEIYGVEKINTTDAGYYEHSYAKFKVDEANIPTRAISLMWNQRSVDTFLGLPFNIASYGLLLEIIAKEVNMVPDQLIGNLGDTHLYSNHIDAAKEQIGRELTERERLQLVLPDVTEQADALMSFGLGKLMSEANEKNIPKRTREPFPLPTLHLESEVKWAEGDCLPTYSVNDITVENYQSHPTIKAPLSN